MKKYPKYIVMPTALLIYFIVMTIYGLKMNNWKLQEDFWTICITELVTLVALFFALRYLDKKRKNL